MIKGISEFLGTDRDDEYIQKVADMCHFKGMKKADEGKDIERFKFEADMMTGHYRKGIKYHIQKKIYIVTSLKILIKF